MKKANIGKHPKIRKGSLCVLAVLMCLLVFGLASCFTPKAQPAAAPETPAVSTQQLAQKMGTILDTIPAVQETTKIEAKSFKMFAEDILFDASTGHLTFNVRIPDSFKTETDRLGFYTLLPAIDLYQLPEGLELVKAPIVDEQHASEEKWQDAVYRVQLFLKVTGDQLYGKQAITIAEKAVINGCCEEPKYSEKLEISFSYPEKPEPVVVQHSEKKPAAPAPAPVVKKEATAYTNLRIYLNGAKVLVTYETADGRDTVLKKSDIKLFNCGKDAVIGDITKVATGKYQFYVSRASQPDKSKECFVSVLDTFTNGFIFKGKIEIVGGGSTGGDTGNGGGTNPGPGPNPNPDDKLPLDPPEDIPGDSGNMGDGNHDLGPGRPSGSGNTAEDFDGPGANTPSYSTPAPSGGGASNQTDGSVGTPDAGAQGGEAL